MSITDEARLDALDRRGRAAARTLLDDLAARGAHTLAAEHAPTAAATGPAATAATADTALPAGAAGTGPVPSDPPTSSTEPASIPATEPLALPEPTVIHLDRPAVRGGGGRRRARRRLLGAAVVAALAAVGGAVVATRDDGRPDVSSGREVGYLLPGWLPAGFEPVHAIDVPDAAALGFGADITVYGDPDTDDPWSATLVVIHLVADEELLGGPPSGSETVTVAGHDARLREGFGDGRGWEVEWQVDDGRLIVGGALTRDEVLAAAETATTEPALDASGLPDGYEELASGPTQDSPLFTSLFEGAYEGDVEGSVDDSGLAVAYADPSDSDAVRTAVVVAQRPGPASAVDLLRLSFPDADATTVRGRHAVIGRGSEPPGSAGETGVVAVQWAEPEGQLVTVVGFGVAEDAVLQVAEGMHPASAGEVAALGEEPAAAASREFGDVPEGQVVAASGESRTGQWRVVADARPRANVGALTLERVWGAIGSTASTTGDRVEPPLDLAADISDGTVVIWGVLWVDAASVTVEAPDREPVTLELHEVDGWSHPVVAGAFPDDHFPPSSSEVVVVARDADGREVARNETVLGPGG
jgi:hypothetical protein